MRSSAILLVALLSGCATQIEYIEVEIPIETRIPVPAELSRPCPRPEYLKPLSLGNIVILARAALAVIDACNLDKAAIRALE